jgi:hypothetical protein
VSPKRDRSAASQSVRGAGTPPMDLRRPTGGTLAMRRRVVLPASAREPIIVAACAVMITVGVYLPHVIKGGWVLDDWSLAARFHLSGSQSLPHLFHVAYGITTRPGQAAFLAFMWKIGGLGQTPYLVVATALAAIEGFLFYFVLRLVFPRLIAGLAAALVIVLPVMDATRLWAAASGATLAVILVLCGDLAALAGLRCADRRARLLLHALALVLFLAGTLTYELVAPIVALAVLTYAFQSGWRPAFKRWPFDVVVAAAGATTTAVHRAANTRPARTDVAFLLDRAGSIVREARRVFFDTLPLGQTLWGPVGGVLLVAMLALLGHAVVLRAESRPQIVRATTLLSAGALFAFAGLIVLLPADPYYVPRISGIGDRISAVAALGFVVMAAALAMLVGLAIGHLMRRDQTGVVLAGAALAVVLGVNVHNEVEAQRPWDDSWRMSQKVVSAVRATLPSRPPPSSAVVTFRHVTNILPADVPVFYASWDLTGALQLAYGTTRITGHPWNPLMQCENDGARFPDVRSVLRYGSLWFVDAAGYRAYRIRSASDCSRESAALSK